MRGSGIRMGFAAAIALAALVALAPGADAQTAGTKDQRVNLLFVQNSTGVVIEKNVLRLKNVSASTLFFADRPVRLAGHYHTKGEFLKLWNEGPDSFARNPPNATLSFVEPNQPDLLNIVVNLRNPRMQKNDLIYDITVVEGTPPKTAGAAVLFIDVFGIWRRNIRRVAIVSTTAAVASSSAAAASASAASAQAAAAAAPYVPPATMPPPGPNAQHTQVSATQKLDQLKALLGEGLITQAQYNKASQQIVNELVQ